MQPIIQFIEQLVKDGYAYEVDGDVYFRVTKIKEYGMLSGIKIEDLIAGASERVEDNDKKKVLLILHCGKKLMKEFNLIAHGLKEDRGGIRNAL